MTLFVEIRTLSGVSYVRAPDVIAVQFVDNQKSTVLMAGGTNLSCAEPAKVVLARIEATLQQTTESPDGDGSR